MLSTFDRQLATWRLDGTSPRQMATRAGLRLSDIQQRLEQLHADALLESSVDSTPRLSRVRRVTLEQAAALLLEHVRSRPDPLRAAELLAGAAHALGFRCVVLLVHAVLNRAPHASLYLIEACERQHGSARAELRRLVTLAIARHLTAFGSRQITPAKRRAEV